MPIAFDPSATTPVWLDEDESMPEDSRPTFDAKFLTARDRMEVRKLANAAFEQFKGDKLKAADEEAASATARRALSMQVIGWRNLPVAFSPDAFDQVLTVHEMIRLAWRCLSRTRLSEVDRFLSSAPSASKPAASANTAATEDASTNPPTAQS